MDVLPIRVFFATYAAWKYPFLITKDQHGIIRFNKIKDDPDSKLYGRKIIGDFLDSFEQDPLLDQLITYMNDKIGNDIFDYLFAYGTTFIEGDTYQKRAQKLINYILNQEKYNLVYYCLKNLEKQGLLQKDKISIEGDKIIKNYLAENNKLEQNKKTGQSSIDYGKNAYYKIEKNNVFLVYFLREFIDPNTIDTSVAKIYLDYYANNLDICNKAHCDNEKKEFLKLLIKKVWPTYSLPKSVLLLSTLQDISLLEIYQPYLEKIGFIPKDFMDLQLFIFPLIKAYNQNIKYESSEMAFVKKDCQKIIRYLLKNNINFLKTYEYCFIKNLLKTEHENGMKYVKFTDFVIPNDLWAWGIQCYKKIKQQTSLSRKYFFTNVLYNLLSDFDDSRCDQEKNNVLDLLNPLFEISVKWFVFYRSTENLIQNYFKYLFSEQLKSLDHYKNKKHNALHALLLMCSDYDSFKQALPMLQEKIENFSDVKQLLNLKNHKDKTPLELEKELYPNKESILTKLLLT